MKKINKLKLLLDLAMIIVLVLMYNHHALGLTFHEVGGLILLGVFVIHVILNRKWVSGITKRIFDKNLAIKTRISYILNMLLAISFLLTGISGVLISKVVFHFNLSTGGINWQGIHIGAAAFALVLIGVHVGLHYQYITGMLKKMIPVPLVVSKAIGIVLFVLFVGYGAYSFQSNNFIGMLERPFVSQQSGFQQHQMNSNPGQEVGTESGFSNSGDSSKSPKTGDWAGKQGQKPSGDWSGKDTNKQGGNYPGGSSSQGGATQALLTVVHFGAISMLFACLTILIETCLRKFKRKKDVTNNNVF